VIIVTPADRLNQSRGQNAKQYQTVGDSVNEAPPVMSSTVTTYNGCGLTTLFAQPSFTADISGTLSISHAPPDNSDQSGLTCACETNQGHHRRHGRSGQCAPARGSSLWRRMRGPPLVQYQYHDWPGDQHPFPAIDFDTAVRVEIGAAVGRRHAF
jgi:hypothetical protein